MVLPLTGPAGPGGDAAASYQQANPTTPSTDRLLLWAISWVNRTHLPLAVRLTRRSPRRPLARKREKLNWRPPPRSRAVVVDPRASIWKIRLHQAGLSGGSGLINLIPPTTVACNTKTRLKTPMTPTNPLTGLSQVLLRLPWPPALLATLPSHPSDGRGVFHSASPLPLYMGRHFIDLYRGSFRLNTKAESSSVSVLITFSHRKSKASDYGSSDSTVPFVYAYF